MDRKQRWTMTAVVLGSGIVFLDSTVVNVALQRIGEELPRTYFGQLEGQSYVYNGYLLSLSALLVLAGALSDHYGRRRLFAIGLVGFGVTSIMCGLAPTMEVLVAFRMLQGAAGAILVPGSLALIRSSFSGEEQGSAFGIWAGASAFTVILGPLIGGVLVDTLSWRAAFLINVPLIALALFATIRHVSESRDEQTEGTFDWLGALVVVIALGGLVFGVIRGEQRRWDDTVAFISLALGGVASIAFVFLMAKRRNPLVPLGLFKSRNFTVTNIATLLIYGALYVSGYFTALFLQGTIGYNAAGSGLSGLPGIIFLAFLSPRFGRLAARFGPRIFMTIGPALMGLGLLWLSRVPSTTEAWKVDFSDPSSLIPPASYMTDVFGAWILFGIGLVVMVAPLTTAVMTSVEARYSGIASAVNNSISRVGPQLAGAAIFVAISSAFYSGLADDLGTERVSAEGFREEVAPLNRPKDQSLVIPVREASTNSFHVAMRASAGLLFAGALVSAVGISDEQAKAGSAVDEPEPVQG